MFTSKFGIVSIPFYDTLTKAKSHVDLLSLNLQITNFSVLTISSTVILTFFEKFKRKYNIEDRNRRLYFPFPKS